MELLRDPDRAGEQATAELLGHLQGLRVVDRFDEAAELYAQGPLSAGQALASAVADVDGGSRPAGLGRALDLVEQGRGPELVVAFTRDRRTAEDPARDVADTRAVPLAALAGEQLVGAGTAAYEVSFGGPLRLVTGGSGPLDLAEEAHTALLAPDRLAALRRSWTARGIDLGDRPGGGAALTPEERDRLTMVLPAARVSGSRGARADLLLTHEALLVGQYAEKTGRLKAMTRAYREAEPEDVLEAAQQRLAAIEDATPAQIAAMPGVTRYRWDDLHRVVVAGKDAPRRTPSGCRWSPTASRSPSRWSTAP